MRTTHLARTLSILVLTIVAGCLAEAGDDPDPEGPAGPDNPLTAPPEDPGPTPGEVSTQLIAAWMDCMRFEDFQAANMAPAWFSLPSDEQICGACHATGSYGFIASSDAPLFFNAIKTNRYYLHAFITVDLSAGLDRARMIVNQQNFERVASGAPPYAEHPRFDGTNGAGMAALRLFYDRTDQRQKAGLCGPPAP